MHHCLNTKYNNIDYTKHEQFREKNPEFLKRTTKFRNCNISFEIAITI